MNAVATGEAALFYRLLDDGNGVDCDVAIEWFENERLPLSRFPKEDKVTRTQIAWTMTRIKSLQAYHSLIRTPSLLEGGKRLYFEEVL
jgi:hypothetical protein